MIKTSLTVTVTRQFERFEDNSCNSILRYFFFFFKTRVPHREPCRI